MFRAVVRQTLGSLSTSFDEIVVYVSAQMDSLAKTKVIIHKISTTTLRFRTAYLITAVADLPDESLEAPLEL